MFDRQHIGVACRLAQKLDHNIEAFEGVVNQNVFFANCSEAIPGVVANTFGEAGFEGFEFQVCAVRRDQLRQFV